MPESRVLPPLTLRGRSFNWGEKTYIMGVLNVTPDSFSDGGEFATLDRAISRGEAIAAAGADLVDIGGQSTRPGAETISLEEERRRVLPVVAALRERIEIPISVDTTRAEIAAEAIAVGADLVNDISGGTFDEQMLPTVAKLQVPIALMHLRGTPKTMQQMTAYDDVVAEIARALAECVDAAVAAGVDRSLAIADPGIGFAKTAEQNLEILRRLSELQSLGVPLLVGTSRKRFIGRILDRPEPKERVWGTAASCCAAIAGGADILRVHDIAEMLDTARVADAIWRARSLPISIRDS